MRCTYICQPTCPTTGWQFLWLWILHSYWICSKLCGKSSSHSTHKMQPRDPSLANLSPSFSALTSFSTSFSVVLFQIPHHIFSFLSVCPIHFHFLILIFTIISSSPIMPHVLFLEVISCHLKNLQKHWFINVCNLWARKMIIL